MLDQQPGAGIAARDQWQGRDPCQPKQGITDVSLSVSFEIGAGLAFLDA